jgi:aminoglycoside 2''-phosphotransferase
VTDALAAALAAQVRAAFPNLAFSHAALNERGEDHQVLVLDDRYVFRFPRHADHPTGLAFEIAVLRALNGRCALATPDYRFVAPSGDFAGYQMIEGVELTPGRFAALEQAIQELVLNQIADLLSAIHGLDLSELRTSSIAAPRERTPADYAIGGRARRLPPIARAHPDLAPLVEGFYARFECREAGVERLMHGDVTDDHLLLAPAGDRLGGVIDFGDAGLGDPMHDFCYLWSYGDWAPAHVFERYALKDQDPGLLERSRWGFARYRISRLAEALEREWGDTASDLAASLPALLESL